MISILCQKEGQRNTVQKMYANDTECVLQVVDEGLDRVLVLEDDIDFEPRFREGLAEVMKEAEVLTPSWDLM